MQGFDACDDVFSLLAGSAHDDNAECRCGDEMDEENRIPLPFHALAGADTVIWDERPFVVQTVLLSDVRDYRDSRFNSTNHHEWAPFRCGGEGAVQVDSAWWASLSPEQHADIEKVVAVEEIGVVEVPHTAEILVVDPCNQVYNAYVDGFSFARWQVLKPEAVLVPLPKRDRLVLEAIARRHALGGSAPQASDLEDVGSSLLESLSRAISQVGGRAFAKTAEKSAKNDAKLQPHETPASILFELTTSMDVLRQSLGSGGTGKRRTAEYLVVQPWDDNVSASNEFRVIIVGRKVVGISQQTWCSFVGHTEESAAAVVHPLLRLWYDVLLPVCPYADCVLDAYVVDGIASVIEINPCGFWGSSGSALFHWLIDREVLLGDGPLPIRVVVETPHDSTIYTGEKSQ